MGEECTSPCGCSKGWAVTTAEPVYAQGDTFNFYFMHVCELLVSNRVILYYCSILQGDTLTSEKLANACT